MQSMKRKKIFRSEFALVCAALSFLGTTSCGIYDFKKNKNDKDDQSQVETLDNLAKRDDAEINPNQCRPFGQSIERKVIVKEENISVKNVSAASADYIKDEIYSVMANVPQSVLAVFFALDGKVEANTETSAICQNLIQNNAEHDASQYKEGDQLVSCWKRDENGAPTIYIDPTITVTNNQESALGIHHGLLRSFGYVASELFLSLDITVDENDPKIWHAKEIAQPKEADRLMLENLSKAFVEDVKASNGKYNLDNYQHLINGSDEDKIKFSYFVFAEAFDSYHCSEQTHNLIATDFPETYKNMSAVVETLNKLEDYTQSTEPSSLNLTDASASVNYTTKGCQCFGGFAGIFSGIFQGIKNLIIGAVQIIKTIVIGAFKIIAIPFKVAFGIIKCIFTPLRVGVVVGTTPVTNPVIYTTPLQRSCQAPGQSICKNSPTQGDEGVVTHDDNDEPVTTVTSKKESDNGKTAKQFKPADELIEKSKSKGKKKKWYQCGTIGNMNEHGMTPIGLLLLMFAPLAAIFVRRKVTV